MTSIRTRRLNLTLLPEEFLEASVSGARQRAAELLGAAIPEEWWPERDLVALRLADMRAEAAYRPWCLRAMVQRETRIMVGFCGFHTAPDPPYLAAWAPDAVEFGYTVFSPFRQQGFATEAGQGLMRWAERQPGVHRFVLSIAAANRPSAVVAGKLGFAKVGAREDPVNGIEEIYVAEARRTGARRLVLSLIEAVGVKR